MKRPLLVRGSARFPHLPSGREPGAQSVRAGGGWMLWEWFSGLVGLGMVGGGIFLAAGGRGPGFDPVEETVGGIVFALGGLIPTLWAYSLLRKRRPVSLRRRLRGVDLAVPADEARRGEEVNATVTVPRGAEHVEVGVVCVERYDIQTRVRTRYGSTTVRQTLEAVAHEEWRAVQPASGGQTLSFELPREAPYSYEGECVSYAWRLSLRRVERLRADPRIDHVLWVRP